MTIEEAIHHCEEVAGEQQEIADSADMVAVMDGLDVEACYQCASDHRQLAEWLRELQEAKRLLNEAVLAFRIMGEDIDCHFNFLCEKCPLNNNTDWCEWKYQEEAEKLLKDGESNG